MDKSIEARIKEMIVQRCFLDVDPESIGDEDNLMETLGLDSVSILELVVGLEEVFGVTFEDTEFNIESFQNVASMAAYVRERTEAS
jgi:acyl carrier protein